MSKRMGHRFLSLFLLMLAFAAIGAAHEVTITDRTKLRNGSELKPGEYQVKVVKNQDTCEVLFYNSGDLSLRAPATLAVEPKKASQTQIHYEEIDGGKVITRIDLEGSKEALVFNSDAIAKAE